MIRLPRSLAAWASPAFRETLQAEIEQLDAAHLPLQQGLTTSSHALYDKIKVHVIGVSDDAKTIHAKVGIFYTGIIAGCSCADDPTPVEEQPEYCVVQVDIDKRTAESTIALLIE